MACIIDEYSWPYYRYSKHMQASVLIIQIKWRNFNFHDNFNWDIMRFDI